MKYLILFVVSAFALAVTGCDRQVDTAAEEAAVRAADRAWESATNDSGVAGWMSFLAENATLYPPGEADVTTDTEAIRAVLSEVFQEGTTTRWQPDSVVVAKSGEIAHSFGTFETSKMIEGSSQVIFRGKYADAWGKQANGDWKATAVAWNFVPVTTQTPGGADPTETNSELYQVVFENESVRVIRISYGPNAIADMHGHPDSIAVFLTDAEGQFTYPDGSTEADTWKAGEVRWAPATVHQPENTTDVAFELIQIEFK